MAKKEKKISINSLDKILGTEVSEDKEIVYSLPDETSVSIMVKRKIPFQSFRAYVAQVVDSVFIELDDGILYVPENLELAYIHATLEYYTNIKSDMKIDKLYEFGMTELYRQIIEQVDSIQYSTLRTAIDSAIEYRKQEILSSQKKQLRRNIEKIENLTDSVAQFAGLFENIDVSEMADVFQKIAGKDERALAGAILDLKTESMEKETSQIDGQIGFDSMNSEE